MNAFPPWPSDDAASEPRKARGYAFYHSVRFMRACFFFRGRGPLQKVCHSTDTYVRGLDGFIEAVTEVLSFVKCQVCHRGGGAVARC